MLKREVIELSERMQLLQKSSRELELDNEKLVYKVSFSFISSTPNFPFRW